ncbi:tetratricopeptide repeat protein [Guyparkeria sp. SB14A]|uniref:tetratricopeptide repeat protein n=1 Tax=Guyparkeria sp. SB14A TaxID=2571147 RepID=UPI001FFC9F1E|nr:tetratricopeptide repeat protein [Guyparkeria sp. SB14A]
MAVLALWAAMAMLALALWVEWGGGGRRRTLLAVLMIGLAPVAFTTAHAESVVDAPSRAALLDEGRSALGQQEFARAQAAFDRATGYTARLGGGMAAYRRADYPHAVDRLQAAVWLADSPRERMLALFDLGDALVLAGRYRAAVSAFDAVLALDPEHVPASINRRIAARLAQAAQRGADEKQPSFSGNALEQPKQIDPNRGARMSQQMLEGKGAGGGATGGRTVDEAKPFRLDEGLLQGARKKLERIRDRPRPAIRELLRQQPYKGTVGQRVSGEAER